MVQAPASRVAPSALARTVRDAQGTPRYRLSVSRPVFTSSAVYGAISQIREEAADLLAARASDVLQRKIEEIVIRDIMPETDLGLTNEVWLTAALVANDWQATPYINQQLPTTKLLAIYSAVSITTPMNVTAVRLQSGSARILSLVQIERAQGYAETPESIIRPTIIWDPNDTVHIDLYATSTDTQAFIFGGFIAEASGVNVSPPDYT